MSTSEIQFTFEALTPSGSRSRGLIPARNASEARDKLLRQGFVPTRISPRTTHRGKNRQGLTIREASLFAADLSRLLGAGIPLLQALHITNDISRSHRIAGLCRSLAEDVEQGTPLSAALRAYDPRSLAQLAALAHVGEFSGALAETLADAAQTLREAAALRERLASLLIYPAIVALLTLTILLVFLLVVTPALAPVFSEFEGELPQGARILIGASRFLGDWGWAIVATLAAAAVFAIGTKPGRSAMRRFQEAFALSPLALGAPVLSLWASFARSLALCLRHGIPMPHAFEAAIDSIWAETIKAPMRTRRDALEAGQQASDALRGIPHVPSVLIHLVAAGEASGRLAHALAEAAAMLSEEARTRAERLVAVAGPAITMILGGIVGGVVFTLFHALASLAEAGL